MKLIVFLFLAVVAHLLAVPSKECMGGGPLVLEIDSLGFRGPCDRKSTCEYKCPGCNKYVFFDVSNYNPGFKNWCKKMDPNTWRAQQMRNVPSNTALIVALGQVIVRFMNICRTGLQVTPSQINDAEKFYNAELRDSTLTPHQIASGRNLIRHFAASANQQLFGYCSCTAYASKIGKTQDFINMASGACVNKCGGPNSQSSCRVIQKCTNCRYATVPKYKCVYISGRKRCFHRRTKEKKCSCKMVKKCGNTLEEATEILEEMAFE
eukprot:gene3725-6613_t